MPFSANPPGHPAPPTHWFASMPQTQLPFFPEGVTRISDLLAFRVEDGRVTYFKRA
jgi:hypothetical protein